jgi:hypothetical protein
MMDFVAGYFREYWGVLLGCAFAQFVLPKITDPLFERWVKARVRKRMRKEASKVRLGASQHQH